MRHLSALLVALVSVSCGSSGRRPPGSGDGGADGGGSGGGCVGLACYQKDCGTAPRTSLSGRVTAPNGLDPIPEALVYVPVSLPEFAPTVQCEACNEPLGGAPLVSTLSALDGSFRLDNVPVATQVPVVVQKGRFRKVLTLNVSRECQDTALSADQTRLPRNQQEGSLPKMAVGVGHYDQIECVLRAIGIDESEFTAPNGQGAVHLYDNWQGGGTSLESLVTNAAKLEEYNLLFINCTETTIDKWANPSLTKTNLYNYVNAGGRLYVTDWSYDFLEQVQQFSPYISFDGLGATAPETVNAAQYVWDGTPLPAQVSDMKLAAWLKAAGASSNGGVTLQDSWALAHSAASDQMSYPSTTWVRGNAKGVDRPMTITFDYNMCGKVLWSSYHTRSPGGGKSSDPDSGPGTPFPSYCTSTASTMIAQEKILEYLIFHISSCVGPIS